MMIENLETNKTLTQRLKSNLCKVPFLKLSVEEVGDALRKGLLETVHNRDLGIGYIHGSDSSDVLELQKDILKDNPALCKPVWKIESLLFGVEVTHIVRGLPFLSFGHRLSNGALDGYIIAYEGVHPSIGRIIYISDWMSKTTSAYTAGKLLNMFLKEYAAHYISKGLLVSIYFNARASTSRRILLGKMEGIANMVNKSIGDVSKHIIFHTEEYQVREDSGESFSDLSFVPRLKPKS